MHLTMRSRDWRDRLLISSSQDNATPPRDIGVDDSKDPKTEVIRRLGPNDPREGGNVVNYYVSRDEAHHAELTLVSLLCDSFPHDKHSIGRTHSESVHLLCY